MAITMGDASGVGPEIVLRRAAEGAFADECVVVYGDLAVLRHGAELLGIDVAMEAITDPRQWRPGVRCRSSTPAMLDRRRSSSGRQIDAASGAAARQYVVAATDDALAGRVAGIVTMPMNKEATQLSDPTFVGHTELIAAACGVQRYTMMLTAGDLAVTHVSTHVSLREAITRVTTPRVLEVIELTHETLRRFIDRPRIAVCGVNPHAGEHGLFGSEDADAHRSGDRGGAGRRHRRQRPASGRHRVPSGGEPQAVRRDRVHVPRPGAHADEAAGVRERRQRDHRPADHRARQSITARRSTSPGKASPSPVRSTTL